MTSNAGKFWSRIRCTSLCSSVSLPYDGTTTLTSSRSFSLIKARLAASRIPPAQPPAACGSVGISPGIPEKHAVPSVAHAVLWCETPSRSATFAGHRLGPHSLTSLLNNCVHREPRQAAVEAGCKSAWGLAWNVQPQALETIAIALRLTGYDKDGASGLVMGQNQELRVHRRCRTNYESDVRHGLEVRPSSSSRSVW